MQARAMIGIVLFCALIAFFSIGSTATYLFFADQGASVSGFSEDRISALSVLVKNDTTGTVLFSRGAGDVRPIASIVKLFTAHVATRSPALDESTLIVWQDYATEGTAGALWLGERYTVRDLLFPLLLSSSNDAGAAIRRTIGQTYFSQALDALSLDAGLLNTAVVEPTGLSARNTSTADDLARFLAYLDRENPYVLDITSLPAYMGTYRGWKNNNPARVYKTFRGGKHGYLPESGRTFAGRFVRAGDTYTIVLLGSSDLVGDLAETLSLLPPE